MATSKSDVLQEGKPPIPDTQIRGEAPVVSDPGTATWAVSELGTYTQVSSSTNRIPAGVYYHYSNSSGNIIFNPAKYTSDQLLDLPGLPTRYILEQIDNFWCKTAEYAKYGFIQKRGIMLYGPPGCGKTSVTNLLKRQIVERDGVVFLATNGYSLLTEGLAQFRKVEPTRPCMTLIEDLESYMESSNNNNQASQERAALALYDGERQFNNIVHVATTNKPDLLNDRFIRRPGRFDLIIGLFQPTEETREAYLRSICNGQLDCKQLREIVAQTDGLSLAYLREIVTTYLILGIPLEETVARLRELETKKYPVKGRTGYTIGFTGA
jgi:hypothetical protein